MSSAMLHKNRFINLFCAFLVIVFLTGCTAICSNGLTEQDLKISIEHDGFTRTFILHLPRDFQKQSNLPLVIAMHGGSGTGKGMIKLTKGKFNELADKYNFLVVYPDGLGKSWHDDRSDPISFAHKNNIDDIGFLRKMIEKLISEYHADPGRIFATGISNGGFMCFRISRSLTDYIKAVAPVCACIPVIAKDMYLNGPPMNIMLINGTADPLVPYDGGEVEVLGRKRGKILSTDETIDIFLKRNNLTDTALVKEFEDKDQDDGTRVLQYEWSDSVKKVVLIKVINGGHTWPDGWQYLHERLVGKTTHDINACEVIWEFFCSLK